MNGNIVFGMLALKNVGKQFVESIIRERQYGDFKDFEDFINRMSAYDLNKRMVEALIKSGAFDNLGVYRSQLLSVYEVLIDKILQKDRNNVAGQLDMFSVSSNVSDVSPKIDYPDIRDFSLREKLLLEKECSGMYFSGHLIDGYDKHIAYLGASSVAEILANDEVEDKTPVKIAGIVSSITPKTTKKGDRMVFFSVEDRYGEIECLAFPSQYSRFSHLIRIEAPLYIQGVISISDRDEDSVKIIANTIQELTENSDFDIVSKNEKKAVARREEAVKPITKVFLRVPNMSCDQYFKAKRIIDSKTGQTSAVFYDSSTSSYKVYSEKFTADETTVSDLKRVLGDENVVVKS